jgi:hypothetical protein
MPGVVPVTFVVFWFGGGMDAGSRPVEESAERASRQLRYRDFTIEVSASRRLGGIIVTAALSGGPNRIARHFGLPSSEQNVECACAVAIHELRKIVDDLIAQEPPVAAPRARAQAGKHRP